MRLSEHTSDAPSIDEAHRRKGRMLGGAMQTLDLSTHTELSLLIVFVDLTRYTAETLRAPDHEVGRVMDAFYERVAARVLAASGKVVKFIGDAALLVFREADVDRGVQ